MVGMRVSRITVTGLFGKFNHAIPLFLNESVTIVHSPNGYGKTTVFKLIDSLFNWKLSQLSQIQFEKFCVEFDDCSSVTVRGMLHSPEKRQPTLLEMGDKSPPRKIRFDIVSPKGRKSKVEVPITGSGLDLVALENRIARTQSRIEETRIADDKRSSNRDAMTSRELERRLSYLMHERNRLEHSREFSFDPMPIELGSILSQVKVTFVESQRLLQKTRSDSDEFLRRRRAYDEDAAYAGEEAEPFASSVVLYSNEIAKEMESLLAQYASTSQELDRRFPDRLIKELLTTSRDKDETRARIENELKELDKRTKGLVDVGLIEAGPASLDLGDKRINRMTRKVLSLYIRDTKEKYEVFRDFERKMRLLKSIIDTQYMDKTLMIQRKRGFVFGTKEGKVIPPKDMSSGEQHELVLNYVLLFKTEPGSLILIDEPEISLHIAWQKKLVRNMQEIARITDSHMILATHSPQVIHDRWDLTVGLKGESN
jgi:ABC-type cobalamin/Fe3+-siderophores transport system ATPase subunit